MTRKLIRSIYEAYRNGYEYIIYDHDTDSVVSKYILLSDMLVNEEICINQYGTTLQIVSVDYEIYRTSEFMELLKEIYVTEEYNKFIKEKYL